MTPYETLLAETEPEFLLRVLYYANAIRALQGLAPTYTLRRPDYILAPAHRIQCPFWITCTDIEHPTHYDIDALILYLQQFGFIAITPAWLSNWLRRHQDIYHTQLQVSTP